MSEFFFHHGVRLAFERHGEGRPLVLIHGYPLDRSIWRPLLPYLAGLQLILPDVRGFGESEVTAPGFTMDDLADDLAALLAHLGLESAFIGGHSMGGYIVLAFARRYPQRLQGLALIASQAAADTPERRSAREETARRIEVEGHGFIAESMPAALTPNMAIQAELRQRIQAQPALALIGALGAMAARAAAFDVLQRLSVPLLLIHGQADMLIPIERAREVKALRPQARLVELPAVGHMPMLEMPRLTAQALREWCGFPSAAMPAA